MRPYGIDAVADYVSHEIDTTSVESWRTWYKSPIWKAIKRHRLIQEPNCRLCAQEGRTVIATMWLISSLTEVNGRYLPATRTPKASALAITNGKGGIETQLELKSADSTTRNWRARPSESAKRCLPEFS